VRHAFARRHRGTWSIVVQCRVLQVSAIGYHQNQLRQAADAGPNLPAVKPGRFKVVGRLSDTALAVHIKAVFAEMQGAYGWPRISCRSDRSVQPAGGRLCNGRAHDADAGDGGQITGNWGSQYASNDYQQLLRDFKMESSMSRKGDCWDNAITETLFGSLKVERLRGMNFGTRPQAKDEVVDWIAFYNHRRLHSTLSYASPMAFEQKWLARQISLAA
jgi:transposase InsO family protein